MFFLNSRIKKLFHLIVITFFLFPAAGLTAQNSDDEAREVADRVFSATVGQQMPSRAKPESLELYDFSLLECHCCPDCILNRPLSEIIETILLRREEFKNCPDCFFNWDDSRFPMPEEPEEVVPEEEPLPDPEIAAYIGSINSNVDSVLVAKFICDAARAQGLDPWLLVAVAQFESTYWIEARGGAGERGLLQVHPCHFPRFKAYGCDPENSYDVVRFGAAMMRESLDKGYDLNRTLEPWAVRYKAMKLYGTFDQATGTGKATTTTKESTDEGRG